MVVDSTYSVLSIKRISADVKFECIWRICSKFLPHLQTRPSTEPHNCSWHKAYVRLGLKLQRYILYFTMCFVICRDREERYRFQDIRPAFQPNPRFTRCPVCSLLAWNGETYREKYPR